LIAGDIDRRRQIFNHRIKKRLHTLVLEGRATQHRNQRAGDCALADTALQRRLVRLLAAEIGFERVVVLLDRLLDSFAR
jgi:hypothetical protein